LSRRRETDESRNARVARDGSLGNQPPGRQRPSQDCEPATKRWS
jgi:hypothetical protein